MNDWYVFRGTGPTNDDPIATLLAAPSPPWRTFRGQPTIERTLNDPKGLTERRGTAYRLGPEEERKDEVELVNAALYLRRPLLVTGKPGTGKSSLAHAVAHELKLGPVLEWAITTRATLQQGLYEYDAIGRLQEMNIKGKVPDIGDHLRLGPLGTALLPTRRPRVLLIDEIDKSDIDLPNDLLHVIEQGEYQIPELKRLAKERVDVEVLPWDGDDKVQIKGGQVRCREFPFIVLTSNGERDFPPAFLRRCLRLTIQQPSEQKLALIVEAHFKETATADGPDQRKILIDNFLTRRTKGELATDQLLNALYLTSRGAELPAVDGAGQFVARKDGLIEKLWRFLSSGES